MTKQDVFNSKARCMQLAKQQQIMLLKNIQEFIRLNRASINGKKYDGHIVNKLLKFLKDKIDFEFNISKEKESILLTIEVERFSYTDYLGKTVYIPYETNNIDIPVCISVENKQVSISNLYDNCTYRIQKLKNDINKCEQDVNNYEGALFTRNQLIKQIEEYRRIYGDTLFYDLMRGNEHRI